MISFKNLMVLAACVAPLWTIAAEPEGTWKFDTSATFKIDFKAGEPDVKTIIFQAPGAVLNGNCRVRIRNNEFAFDEVFQPLMKQGVTSAQLEKFLKQKFNFTLANKSQIYQVVGSAPECAHPVSEFFIEGNQLLVPVGGNFFYRYLKTPSSSGKPAVAGEMTAVTSGVAGGAVTAELVALKLSRIPFSYEAYYNDCARRLQVKAGALKAAEKCAPAYFPYVAAPGTKSALQKLIGNHDFSKTGGEYAVGYGMPFKFKRTPTFVVLPPHKGVYVIRVDDLEPIKDEERDRFSGAFISVKDGEIVDQLDTGCTFNAEYVCASADGTKRARLSESGKFVERQAR
ncbi:hypothetical protein KY495_09860 [Massilia sp. PAMC28688]|uniref:hypothetical protein n=1 Tax=Massilia sp. PAMC28688 TaxID=2861283 RepID=UPI001C628155|nr:hypothetical protein [Massilia sp. PAMC28688]QYF95424.1 hypothetical protein KY495_09860 [Massilia sp. PAMC28688]